MPSLPDIGGSFDFCMPDFALPSLTSLNMQLPGWDVDFCGYEFDTCKALAISIPLIFLITPCIFNWEVYEKEDEGKTNNKLVDFVRENPMLVFWTGYAMTFLNTMIIAFCYCGVPEIPLPDCMTKTLCSISSENGICTIWLYWHRFNNQLLFSNDNICECYTSLYWTIHDSMSQIAIL